MVNERILTPRGQSRDVPEGLVAVQDVYVQFPPAVNSEPELTRVPVSRCDVWEVLRERAKGARPLTSSVAVSFESCRSPRPISLHSGSSRTLPQTDPLGDGAVKVGHENERSVRMRENLSRHLRPGETVRGSLPCTRARGLLPVPRRPAGGSERDGAESAGSSGAARQGALSCRQSDGPGGGGARWGERERGRSATLRTLLSAVPAGEDDEDTKENVRRESK